MSRAEAGAPRPEDLRILTVEDRAVDEPSLRDALESSGFGNVESVTDAARMESRYSTDPPDLVLVDLADAVPERLDALERLSPRIQARDSVPVVVATSCPELRARALQAGAHDFMGKPLDAEEVVVRVRNQLELRALRLRQGNADEARARADRARARADTIELEAARFEVVERLARAGEFRDDETGEHTRRVGRTAERLARAAGIDTATARMIGVAAPLHDIGKIAIPDSILLLPGRLSPDQIELMQRHTTIGAQILDGSSSELLNLARDIALSHHERWDGEGYPAAVSGRDIPLAGRIVALADVFDALTHERPYKPSWTVRAAVDEIAVQRGRQFDPALVDAFLTLDHAALI